MISKDLVLESLRTTSKLVLQMVASADASLLKIRPQPDQWSIHEHVCHLADVQPLMMKRLAYILAHDHPHISGYQPDRDESADKLLKMDWELSLDRYEKEREEMIAVLAGLTDAAWHKGATHEEYLAYSVAIMFRHLTLHDYLHAYRIEALLLERGT